MTRLDLAGCRTTPLGSYLKALGVLRLVALQADERASGGWHNQTFTLDSALDGDELVEFFTGRYRPTPVLSPWNKDSGFKETGSTATTTLLAIEASDDDRFAAYQQAIAVVRRLRSDPAWADRPKAEQVALLRNRLPDDAIDWLDAAIVLRPEKPAFPALLGAGGNFGRLELSPTFMSRLLLLLDQSDRAKDRNRAWLRSALFDEGSPALRSDPIGQFDPGAAGGVRADAVGGGKAITNPWDLVLAIEGSLVWASGVARRLGGATTTASMPFTVAPTPVGQASLSPGEKAKAEVWAPLWSNPLGLPALRRLFAEGRISWSGRQARTGLDVARAVHTLGADAGVSAFERHIVADRMGQSPLAVPVGRFAVRSDDRADVAVLASLDDWVERMRRAASAPSAPTSFARVSRRVDEALFAVTSGKPRDMQEVLVAVAAAESVIGTTERARTEGPLRPVPWLSARDWLPALDDGSPELRLAAALALARDDTVGGSGEAGLVRSLVRPVRISPRTGRGGPADRYGGSVHWARTVPRAGGLGTRPLVDVLADVLVARSEAERRADRTHAEERPPGPWFPTAKDPGTGDAEALAAGMVDMARLDDLVAALLLLRPEPGTRHRWPDGQRADQVAVPAWRILAPFYTRHDVSALRATGVAPAGDPLSPQLGWARRLAAGDISGVLADALLRWQVAGHAPVYGRNSAEVIARAVAGHGRRLAAALMCGASRQDIERAASAVIGPLPQTRREGEPA